MTSKRYVIAVIICIFLAIGMISNSVMQHELSHKAIYQNYDCRSEIKMKNFYSGYTNLTSCETNFYAENQADVRFLHSLNEIIGYHMFGFESFLFVTLMIFIILRSGCKIEDKKRRS